ncbi:MAG: TrkA family potassium uptake protein [Clostridiales bacterium]|nr:TrkA family potassium uptake protein [Clostridiales bacterium]
MRSLLVIGLGRFGRHLTMSLAEMKNDIMVVDKDEKIVNKLAPYVSSAQIGDCTDEVVLRDLGVANFDICFVCISDDLETSLVITSTLKELGAKKVVTKVNRYLHVKFLLQNGADDVIYPERDMAHRTALKYSVKEAFDYVELNEHYGIFEIAPPKSWLGHTLKEIDVRRKYHVNIIAYKSADKISALDREMYTFNLDEHLIVAGDRKNFVNMVKQKL